MQNEKSFDGERKIIIIFKIIWIICKLCPHILYDFWPPSLPHCSHLSTFCWPPSPVHVNTNFEFDSEFFNKNLTPNTHLHHSFPYKNIKKVGQDENRERIFKIPLHPMNTSTNSTDNNKCGVPNLADSLKILILSLSLINWQAKN